MGDTDLAQTEVIETSREIRSMENSVFESRIARHGEGRSGWDSVDVQLVARSLTCKYGDGRNVGIGSDRFVSERPINSRSRKFHEHDASSNSISLGPDAARPTIHPSTKLPASAAKWNLILMSRATIEIPHPEIKRARCTRGHESPESLMRVSPGSFVSRLFSDTPTLVAK